MLTSIGCAAILAAVAFVLGLIGSLFATAASVQERLIIAVMPAGITFVASVTLFLRDRRRYTSAVRAVRRMLLVRADVSDAEFLAHSSDADPTLVSQTRQAVADFFNVPVAKVYPTDNPQRDFRCDALEPAFHSYVVHHILNSRRLVPNPQMFVFHSNALNSFADFIKEIQRVFDDLDGSETKG